MTPQEIISKYDHEETAYGTWQFLHVKDAKRAFKELEEKFPGRFWRDLDTIGET